MPTTILLADDHPLFRKGLRLLLDEELDMRVVGEAGDGQEAIVGAPLTPVSVGGVRRRTRRRTAVVVGTTAAASTAAAVTAARVAVGTRVFALPGGCQTAIVGGVNYHRCNGVFYRPYYEGSTLVYVVENP